MKSILIYNIDNSGEYNTVAAINDDNDAEADEDDHCISGR